MASFVEIFPFKVSFIPFIPGEKPGKGGKRGKVKGFSSSARLRMINKVQELAELPKTFDTLTFPDEYFIANGLSEIEERCRESKKILDNFFRTVLYHPISEKYGLWFIWKLEYERRKSGQLEGQLVPHYHLIKGGDFTSKQNQERILPYQASVWNWLICKDLHYSVRYKHLAVSSHRKSSKWLTNYKQVFYYISKYATKAIDCPSFEESIGNVWGCRGPIPLAKPEKHVLLGNLEEEVRKFCAQGIYHHKEDLGDGDLSFMESIIEGKGFSYFTTKEQFQETIKNILRLNPELIHQFKKCEV